MGYALYVLKAIFMYQKLKIAGLLVVLMKSILLTNVYANHPITQLMESVDNAQIIMYICQALKVADLNAV